MMERLSASLPGLVVESTGVYGLDPDRVEAAAFAWLAARHLSARPGNIPEVTGARWCWAGCSGTRRPASNECRHGPETERGHSAPAVDRSNLTGIRPRMRNRTRRLSSRWDS